MSGSAAEIAELLTGLMGTLKHFGTAMGSMTALTADAARRGRKRVVAALRTEARRQRETAAGAVSSGRAPGSGPGTEAGSSARGDPAVPRAG